MKESEFEFADFDLTTKDWNDSSKVRNNFIVASNGLSPDNNRPALTESADK